MPQSQLFSKTTINNNNNSNHQQNNSYTSSSRVTRRLRTGNVRCAVVWLAAACALALGGSDNGNNGFRLSITSGVTAIPAGDRTIALSPVHHLTKRSFFDIQCKGVYDKSIFARLDRICDDCYNLFREPPLHTLCRKGCFTTEYFKGCLEALQLTDEMEQIQTWIKQLHGAEPGV